MKDLRIKKSNLKTRKKSCKTREIAKLTTQIIINNEYQSFVEKLKTRIESARKNKQEIVDKQNAEIEKAQNDNLVELKK